MHPRLPYRFEMQAQSSLAKVLALLSGVAIAMAVLIRCWPSTPWASRLLSMPGHEENALVVHLLTGFGIPTAFWASTQLLDTNDRSDQAGPQRMKATAIVAALYLAYCVAWELAQAIWSVDVLVIRGNIQFSQLVADILGVTASLALVVCTLRFWSFVTRMQTST